MIPDFSVFCQDETSEISVAKGFKTTYEWLGLPEPAVYKLDHPGELRQISDELRSNTHIELFNDLTLDPGKNISDRFSRFLLQNLVLPAAQKINDYQRQREAVLPFERFFTHFESQLKSRLGKTYEHAQHPCYRDLPWLQFFIGNKLEGETSSAKLTSFEKLVSSGVFHCILYEKLVLYCPFPSKLLVNERGLLHNEDGPAASWKGKFNLYFWNGVEVSKQLIEHPENITAEDVMRETNAERRRCIQEKLGSEAFASLLHLQEIDRDVDLKGNQQILYRTDEKDEVANEHIQFAQVVCPTTGRIYFLCVPPDIRNVWDAVAWTFGKTAESYKPDVEV